MFNTDTNDGSIWLLVILLVLFGGGNAFGNNFNHGSIVYGDTPATTTEVYNATNNQSLFNRLDGITHGITSSAYENQALINNNANSINATLNSGFDSVVSKISDLEHHIDECCCNLKTQMLTDKYENAMYQLNQANTIISNSVQSNNILSQLGRYVTNAPCPSTGCGFANGYNNGFNGYYGTTFA